MRIVPKTFKKVESISFPIWQVARANAREKVKPHQPILKGNFLHRKIDAGAKKSQTALMDERWVFFSDDMLYNARSAHSSDR